MDKLKKMIWVAYIGLGALIIKGALIIRKGILTLETAGAPVYEPGTFWDHLTPIDPETVRRTQEIGTFVIGMGIFTLLCCVLAIFLMKMKKFRPAMMVTLAICVPVSLYVFYLGNYISVGFLVISAFVSIMLYDSEREQSITHAMEARQPIGKYNSPNAKGG